jgi:hypothetical protein
VLLWRTFSCPDLLSYPVHYLIEERLAGAVHTAEGALISNLDRLEDAWTKAFDLLAFFLLALALLAFALHQTPEDQLSID